MAADLMAHFSHIQNKTCKATVLFPLPKNETNRFDAPFLSATIRPGDSTPAKWKLTERRRAAQHGAWRDKHILEECRVLDGGMEPALYEAHADAVRRFLGRLEYPRKIRRLLPTSRWLSLSTAIGRPLLRSLA
jgi:hypothetical protein